MKYQVLRYLFTALTACALVLIAGRGVLSGDAEFREPEYTLENIIIEGAEKTSESVIRSELLLQEGQKLNEKMARISRLKLLGTGFFNAVEMRLERGSYRGAVNWIIKVTERYTFLFNTIFLGLDDEQEAFVGGIECVKLNLLGTGQSFSIAATGAGSDAYGFSLGWSDPYLSQQNFIFNAKIDYRETFERFDEEYDNYDLHYKRCGTRLGVGIRTLTPLKMHSWIQLEQVELLEDPGPDFPEELEFASNQSFHSNIRIDLDWDTRNDYYTPDRGFRFFLSAQASGSFLTSDYNYVKIFGMIDHYFSTWKNHYARLSARTGGVAGSFPVYEQFYLSEAVRGLKFSPFMGVTFQKETPRELLSAGSVEYHIPVVSRPAGWVYGMELFFFFDAGNARNREDELWEEMNFSVGPGLLLNTRIGVFSIDFGFEM